MLNFQSLLNPPVLFFALGLIAQLIRSDLKLPPDLVKSITVYLLLSIGIHGGIELAHSNFSGAVPSIIVAVLMGICIPVIAYHILHRLGLIKRYDAIAIAAHYGSVSAGTFLTAIAFLESMQIPYEKYPVVMLAMMESPAILIGLIMANLVRKKHNKTADHQVPSNKGLLLESFTNGSIVLLFGGIIIGDIVPDQNLKSILPFFDQMFMGILCVFLLAMGMEAAKKIHAFKETGLFLILFGIIMPILLGISGVLIGHFILGFSVGGATLVGVLAGSASYIAVPPAMRIAIPEANPSLYLTLSLGVTFPLNVLVGIPVYFNFASMLVKG